VSAVILQYNQNASQRGYDDSTVELFAKVPGLQDKFEAAADKFEEFEQLVHTVARKLNIPSTSIKIAPPKTPGTIATKADRKYNGNISKVLDDQRATIELENKNDLDNVLRLLEKAMNKEIPCFEHVEVKSLKNTFNDSSYNGLKVVKANFILDDVPTEIMFRYPCNETALHESHGHYEKQRAIEGGISSLFGPKTNSTLSLEDRVALYPSLQKARKRHARKRGDANNKAFDLT